TCSGLPISDFAYSLGRLPYKWYRTIYAFQSGHVHPGEHHRFFTYPGGELTIHLHDENPALTRVLCHGTVISGMAMTEFARLLNKSYQPYIDARYFEDTYPELKRVFFPTTSETNDFQNQAGKNP